MLQTRAEPLEQTERLSSYASPGLLPEEIMEDQMDELRQELDFGRSARSDAEDRLREASLDAQLGGGTFPVVALLNLCDRS